MTQQTATQKLTEREIRALEVVLEYLWDEEERSYEEAPTPDHIFRSLSLLREFLDRQ
jgi:hypothetical protein